MEFFNKAKIGNDVLRRLERRSDHKAASDLIADSTQRAKTVHAVTEREIRRVKLRIMLFRRGLMTQKISVCTGFKICPVALFALFTDRKCHGNIRMHLFDRTDQGDDLIVCKVRVFSALQHDRTESQIISFAHACEDLLICKAVTVAVFVTSVDPAVIAAVFTVIGKLDKAADIHGLSVDTFTHLPCAGRKIRKCIFIFRSKQRFPFVVGKLTCIFQFVDNTY